MLSVEYSVLIARSTPYSVRRPPLALAAVLCKSQSQASETRQFLVALLASLVDRSLERAPSKAYDQIVTTLVSTLGAVMVIRRKQTIIDRIYGKATPTNRRLSYLGTPQVQDGQSAYK